MLEPLVINFFEADFLLMHHQKALENYFRLSLSEQWQRCLSTGLVWKHWIHHPAPEHVRSTHRPLCAHSPGQLLTTTICFSGDWTTWKRQRSLHSYSSGWTKNSKTQFIYGTTIWWQQLPATLLNRPGWKPTALKWMASHYQLTELSNPKQNSILKT